jgi:hypothetical protein
MTKKNDPTPPSDTMIFSGPFASIRAHNHSVVTAGMYSSVAVNDHSVGIVRDSKFVAAPAATSKARI